MADQEASLESSRGPGEVASLSSQGQQGVKLSLDQSITLKAGLASGETSARGGDIGTRTTFSESVTAKIYGNEHHKRQPVQALENEFVEGDTERQVLEERDGVILDVQTGGFEDWKSRETQSSKITGKESEVRRNPSIPSTGLERPGQSASLLRQAAARFLARASSDESKKAGHRVSEFLIQQLRSLAAKERESEAILGRERIQHVVGKVEDEVEFEAVIEEMWNSMRADEEAHEMEQREREFEMERREVQLEDEVGMLQGKVRRLEDELQLANAEKDYALQKKQDEMDDIIQSMLVEIREGGEEGEEPLADGEDDSSKNPGQMLVAAVKGRRAAVSPHKAIFLAFEDMLKEADERAAQDRHVIESTLHAKEDAENVLQQEQRRSHEKERQLESRLLVMEKEVSRLSGVLREAELALSAEQERRKEARIEVDQMLETWREEKKLRGESEDKVKRLASFLMSTKEKLTKEVESGEDAMARIASVVKDLDKELQRANSKRSSTKRSKAVESEQATRWKGQRDVVEAERDELEEKLKLQLRRARDREAEIEAMWEERERNLVTKCSHLEADVAHWETKYKRRESELTQERKLWETELEGYRKQWANEKAGWEALVLQREEWLEEQVAKWTSLVDAKDRELGSLKLEHEELNEVLKAYKQRLESLPQQVYHHQKHVLEDLSQTSISCESFKAGKLSEESEKISEEGEGESQSIEKFVRDIDREEEGHNAERELVTVDLEEDRLEKEELERKVSNTLKLMDEVQTGFQIKVKQFEAEKKKLEATLSSKTAEVEQLVGQLNSRERQMEALMQKFRDEVLNIDREVEKERKEREEVMEMHFVGKRRLVAEMREKEENWQNDLDAMTQELLESRDLVRQKDEDITILKEDLQALDEHRRSEEQKLVKRVSSLMQEKDVLTAALVQEQKTREMVETENQKLEEENVILLDELNAERRRNALDGHLGSTNSWRNVDLHAAVGRVAEVDKQIADAMTAIESLREELNCKETQLAKVKLDNEAEWENRKAILAQEYKEMLDTQEQQWQQEWQRKEQLLLSEKQTILQQLAMEQEEATVMQGALRELEWSIKHGDSESKAKLVEISKKEGMVKVHTSHLEEVDQYILDLQMKLEESEKKRKSAEVAASVRDLKRAASLDAASVQLDRDGRVMSNMAVRSDGNLTSNFYPENGIESLRIRTRSSLGERSGRSSFSSIRELQPDSYWEAENPSSIGRNGGNPSSSLWPGQARDDYSLSVLPPVSPGRRQQKWLVDAAWLEHVRKEQSFLRQQLELERQRVCSLVQVEAENRLIEAAVVRAVEEKHESDSKVLNLQQEVVMLQKMLAARSGTSS